MILADENIDRQLIDWLRDQGVDVYSIAEHHAGIRDEEAIALSKHPPRIILTEDKDFGEWVYAPVSALYANILPLSRCSESSTGRLRASNKR